MASNVEEEGHRHDGSQDFTEDGTVDLKGKPVVRSNTGRWKACSFLLGYEVFERMAYYGIASNLVIYLREKLHEGTVTSNNNVTNWVGTVWMLPILGAYIADAHLGRYWTFFIASIIYLAGMSLLTLAVSVHGLKPPPCDKDPCEDASALQRGIFYAALYTVAAGTGGTKPNISTIGADQFDDFEPKERKQKLSFFNWWMFSVFFGTLFSNTFLIYVQDTVGWTLGYALPTVGLALSIVVFLLGTPFYRHKLPTGSPFTRLGQVFVASVCKRKTRVPDDPKELHEHSLEEYSTTSKQRIDHTTSLRFLDKAAVKTGPSSSWMLCSVTQVEETKQMVKMLPVLLATFIPSTILAQVNTLFIQQGTTLDRSMGPRFEIPPACLTAFVTISMLITIPVYDRLFVPAIRRYTNNPRGITLLKRMGIGFCLHVIIMLIACLTEQNRLAVARKHNVVDKKETVPLTIFVLLPQFALMGVADAFVEVAKLEFFYDQAPESMKSLGTSFFTSSLGVGNFLSSFLLKTVANITKKHGHRGWILDNLNISHLDYYYAFLAILSFINLLIYVVLAKCFVYNIDVDSKRGFDEALETSTKEKPFSPKHEDSGAIAS